MINAAGNGNGGGEEVDEEEDAGQPGAADDGVVGAVAGVAPPDGVAPAVAKSRGRRPGKSRTLPVGVAGVVGPPPAGAFPAVAVACNGSTFPAAAVARNGSDGQISGSSGKAAAGD